nr:MAG TPA: hypothetical protein [Caudoviricetes sp.]
MGCNGVPMGFPTSSRPCRAVSRHKLKQFADFASCFFICTKGGINCAD